MLSPLLWLIFINDLTSAMPVDVQLGVSRSLFADDLALMCQGKTLQECEEKMQPALDCLEEWAKTNKMEISIKEDKDSKTVSCFYTKDFKHESNNKAIPSLHLNGVQVYHSLNPKFLGVTVDQGLTFKEHTDQKTTMKGQRNNILRSLAGKTWGRNSKDLRSVHVTYTQPAAEYAVGAWGCFTSKSHMEKLETKQREAARIITGCCHDTKTEPLLAEAGLTPLSLRAEQEAVFLYERNLRLREDVPARKIAEQSIQKHRLRKRGPDGKVINPPREKAQSILKEIGLTDISREQALTHSSVEPHNWKYCHVRFKPQLAGCSGKNDSKENILKAFEEITGSIREADTVIFTDGSVQANNRNGGAGCTIRSPSALEPHIIKEPCGLICSSYRAEMSAVFHALKYIIDSKDSLPKNSTIWLFTDSESTIQRLQGGPGAQTAQLADSVWTQIVELNEFSIVFQWVPGHADIDGNEEADVVAKEATRLDQSKVPLDFLTVKTAVKGFFREKWRAEVAATQGIYSQAEVKIPPAFPSDISRKHETTIRQLRTGTSPLVRSCWARYAGEPEEERLCPHGCNVNETVKHLFWLCPMYSAQRQAIFATIHLPKNILFTKDYMKIIRFLKDTGHSTVPTKDI